MPEVAGPTLSEVSAQFPRFSCPLSMFGTGRLVGLASQVLAGLPGAGAAYVRGFALVGPCQRCSYPALSSDKVDWCSRRLDRETAMPELADVANHDGPGAGRR